MEEDYFAKNLHHQYFAFSRICKDAPFVVNCKTDVICSFLDSRLGFMDAKKVSERLGEIDNLVYSLEKLTSRIQIAKEKLRIQFIKDQKNLVNMQRLNEKQFTTTSAGIYLAEQLNRKNPFSRAQMNNFIRKGKIATEKVGIKNIIYQGDLDQFITKYKDTLRGI